MSVVILTAAELTVLSAMLGGLLRKRSHAHRVPVPPVTPARR